MPTTRPTVFHLHFHFHLRPEPDAAKKVLMVAATAAVVAATVPVVREKVRDLLTESPPFRDLEK